jgi:hypothetical protein
MKPAFDNFVDDLIRLVGVLRIILGLGAGNFSLLLQSLIGYVVLRDIARLSCGDVHSNVLNELLKLITTRHKVGLAVYFNQHAHLAAHVNVKTDNPFGSDAALSLSCRSQTTLAQDINGPLFISFCLNKCVLTLHHPGTGLFAKLLDGCRCYFCHGCKFLR